MSTVFKSLYDAVFITPPKMIENPTKPFVRPRPLLQGYAAASVFLLCFQKFCMEVFQFLCYNDNGIPKRRFYMKRFRIPSPTRATKILLHIELPLTLLYAVVFLVSYLMALEEDPVRANLYFKPLLVYLLYPAMITSFSVLLVERLSARN